MTARFATGVALVFCALNLVAAPVRAGEFKGNWTITASEEPGMVRFGLFHRHDDGYSQSENDWPVSAFQGLDLATRARHDVQFTIARDAGRFDCDGFVNAGDGAGIFRFTPNPAFVQEMRELGFDGIDANKQFAMAVHDVTLEYARQIKSENLRGMDTEKLIAFRIFDITQQFMRDMRDEGITPGDADQWVASIEQLVALKIHGID
ncbi:MAG TPA: hypothetical protein VFP37_19215 [Steroidobacteraceae bacterium]|nr:hypothetical protein [Steroidobacteraceae bacterium]